MSSKGRQKTKKSRGERCLFCSHTERNAIKFGQMYKYNDFHVHYFCLLLSSGLIQKGGDEEGILGFLETDIMKELRRGDKLRCSYCKNKHATIGCSVKKCKVTFHLPCGLKHKALNQFFNNFDSYCVEHRPQQKPITGYEVNEECPTCYTSVVFDEGIEVLATPCCHKLFHRTCLQKQAMSAGYFFKCPYCNDSDKFIKVMNKFGVYVPKQDASWETENNAYRELYQRYSNCDQETCLCPQSRQFNGDRDWQLLICDTCGSKGTHLACSGRSDWIEKWICDDCELTFGRKDQSLDSNEVISDDESEDDIEIISSFERKPSNLSFVSLSENSNPMFEINVSDDISEKKFKRFKTLEMKDVAIQCNLVSAKDLIDTEPIEDLDPYVFRSSFIALVDKNEETDVIDISDDEIIFLD